MFEESMLAKLGKLSEKNIAGYPPRTIKATHLSTQVKADFENLEGKDVTIAGRTTAIRGHGKAFFMVVADEAGPIQAYCKIDMLGEEKYKAVVDSLDVGDQVVIMGIVFKTRTGEVTVEAKDFVFGTKALNFLPEKFHGLTDAETRYRKRHLDMISNPEVKDRLTKRTYVIKAMREFLWGEGFVEVETPTLQPLYGGALAKPFITHHNALDTDLYLRIAPELYLKRLIVGGMPRIFEIGKAFRNEGISQVHNPEFTIMELYQAWADYNDMMDITERMVAAIAEKVNGSTTILYQGNEVNLKPPWKRITMADAFREMAEVDIEKLRDLKYARDYLQANDIKIEKKFGFGAVIDEILKKKVEANIVQPTFIYNYPIEISPLAKMIPGSTTWTERFQPIICGYECGNAFSELNDPIDQLNRFQAQAKAKAEGDDEAHQIDTDFVEAISIGMPPTGGLGVGVDRLVMLLTDQISIREVLAFPQLRRQDGDIS